MKKTKQEKNLVMLPVRLVGFLILTIVSTQKDQVQGEMFLPSAEGKDQDLKVSDKRINNFRVPMETPFDPNFWPARGRRDEASERNLPNDNCISSDENFIYDKGGLQCQEAPYAPTTKQNKKENHSFLMNNFPGNCYNLFGKSNPLNMPEECRKLFKLRDFDVYQRNFMYRLNKGRETRRNNKQKYDMPEIVLLYGNGVYWDLDNSFEGKEKKEDVFWVARGKRSEPFNRKLFN